MQIEAKEMYTYSMKEKYWRKVQAQGEYPFSIDVKKGDMQAQEVL